MPIHVYPQKLYSPDSQEIRNLIREFDETNLKIIDEKDTGTKIIRLEKDVNNVIDLVFIEVEGRYILNYIEIRMLYERDYKNTVNKIKQHILVYKLDWI
jgi:hypothetical protein